MHLLHFSRVLIVSISLFSVSCHQCLLPLHFDNLKSFNTKGCWHGEAIISLLNWSLHLEALMVILTLKLLILVEIVSILILLGFLLDMVASNVWEFQSFRVPLTFFIVNVCILLKSRKTTLYRKNWQMTKICQIFS